MIPKDSMEEFKTEVLEKLREIKESDGISVTIFVYMLLTKNNLHYVFTNCDRPQVSKKVSSM